MAAAKTKQSRAKTAGEAKPGGDLLRVEGLRIAFDIHGNPLEVVKGMGFSEQFIRMWEYYLCYCEGAFQERYIGDVQMILCKPLCRQATILGTLS